MACLLPWTLAGVVDQGLSPPHTFSSPPPMTHLQTHPPPFYGANAAVGSAWSQPPNPKWLLCLYSWLSVCAAAATLMYVDFISDE